MSIKYKDGATCSVNLKHYWSYLICIGLHANIESLRMAIVQCSDCKYILRENRAIGEGRQQEAVSNSALYIQRQITSSGKLQQLERLNPTLYLLELPCGTYETFVGYIDLISKNVYCIHFDYKFLVVYFASSVASIRMKDRKHLKGTHL